ncbi:aminoimidazole riboside kinase [Aeromonas encheleia]|uniref:aminoimidazole riboside kinase n=1 Tax=Aeromonas TaxID=642 RepID=UPI000F70118A|nr:MULTISPECIES: aminoimidazole riboside kinase [Aeromonas]MBV7436750.1 aminoimidazole riboside kinase [Aeromonas sp. sif2416]MBV7597793.1 aminoimidazole riboside kinase [Aeromonas sp. sia0103]UNP89545.1 aminoimidazole riboside kinase [Aeromonas encheleia]VEG97354.1 aminoimidazole riboside kinase [Aeromonas encheleia]
MQQWSSKVGNRVWVMGDAVVDLIPEGELHYLKCPGGAPANVAVGVARLGGESAFIGRVGADPFGRFMADTLVAEGVDIRHLTQDPAHRTSTVLVELDEEGERSFTFMVRPSADQFLEPADLPRFEAGQWLLTCSIALANEPVRTSCLQAMAAIRVAGGRVCFDPNLRPEVWGNPAEMLPVVRDAIGLADVVKLSIEELQLLSGHQDLVAGLATIDGPALVLVTRGAAGVVARLDGERLEWVGPKVAPLDTTGAGDAFVAGLLAALAQGERLPTMGELPAILAQAHGCGALATTAKGAMTALPTRTQLDVFLRSGLNHV